jgi:hypothetical protein
MPILGSLCFTSVRQLDGYPFFLFQISNALGKRITATINRG